MVFPSGSFENSNRDTVPVLQTGASLLSSGWLEWKETTQGEILFERDGKELKFSEISLDEADQLRLVNQLLAHYRPFALPDAKQYYAAAIGISRQGRLYVSVNNERAIKDSFAGRGCAETTMLDQCQRKETADVMFDAVYLMSGRANSTAKGLTDVDAGHVGCLCGECRRNLRPHADERTKFIMLPANDGKTELTLNAVARSADELQPHQAWRITYDSMYPLPAFIERDASLHSIVTDGYYFIAGDAPNRALETAINPANLTSDQLRHLLDYYQNPGFSVAPLNHHPTLENINRHMVNLVKEAYAEQGKSDQCEISVVVIKTHDGKFYQGVQMKGDVPSKPNAAINALSINKKGIEEVYMMTFNPQRILQEMSSSASATHELKMPDAADLSRIIKNCRQEDDPKLTVFPVNDGTLDQETLETVSYRLDSIRGAFGPDFVNPGRHQQARH